MGSAFSRSWLLDAPGLACGQDHDCDSGYSCSTNPSSSLFEQGTKPADCLCDEVRRGGRATEAAVRYGTFPYEPIAGGVAGRRPPGATQSSTYSSRPIHCRVHARIQQPTGDCG